MSIFLERSYLEVEAEWIGGSPVEFVGESVSCLPLVERTIKDHQDFLSPYGYPMRRGLDMVELRALETELGEWLRDRKSPSAFVRGFPASPSLFDGPNGVPETLVIGSNTFEIDLTVDFENGYSSSLRRDLRRATRESFEISETELLDSPWFADLYSKTMDRLGAASGLQYTPDYFDRLGMALGPSLRVLTAFGSEGEAIASSLFSKGYEADEYMLSCSDFDHPLRGYASKLLIHSAAERSREDGSLALHLGGAPSSNIGLLQMKKRFGTRELQFFSMRVMGDIDIYTELCEGVDTISSEHFPAYRAGTK